MDSVKNVNSDFYGPLMKNISISGGTTKLKGFKERFGLEIRKDCDAYITPKVDIIEDDDAAYKALLRMTQADWFEDVCMTKAVYNDLGFSRLAALI